jgi:flagellum-specific peptidoglycan hydrolase FlgJ
MSEANNMVNWNKYRKLATKAADTYGVPAIVILAIAKQESTNNKTKSGLSLLASKYNNYGGIKYVPKYHTQKVSLTDITYRNGKPTRVPVYFAKFSNIKDSFLDIARIISLHYKGVTDTDKLKNLAKKYAEDPNYYKALVRNIKTLNKAKTTEEIPKYPLLRPILITLGILTLANNIK